MKAFNRLYAGIFAAVLIPLSSLWAGDASNEAAIKAFVKKHMNTVQ